MSRYDDTFGKGTDNGIKSEVDDLSAAFKKMAIIHQRTEENTADVVKSETSC